VNPALAFIYVAVAMMAVVMLVLSVSLWRGSQQGARLAAHQADALNNPDQATPRCIATKWLNSIANL
jgi:hypothetical protein